MLVQLESAAMWTHANYRQGATFLASLLPVAALSTDIARVAVDGLISRDSKFVLGVLTSEYIPRLVGASVVSKPTLPSGAILTHSRRV